MRTSKINNYKATLAHGILISCKAIAKATGILSNDLVRICLGESHEMKSIDAVILDKYANLLEQEIYDITGVRSNQLINRPKPNRYSGRCYMNAYEEWKMTGNEPVIGWEAKFAGRFMSIVPHAFNIDKKGTCYDTANDYKCVYARPCWVRCSGDEAKKWLTEFAKYYRTNDKHILAALPCWTDLWGGLGVVIHSDNKAYLTRTFGMTTDLADKDIKFYKTLDYTPLS